MQEALWRPPMRTLAIKAASMWRLRCAAEFLQVIRFMEGEEEDMGSPSAKTETEARCLSSVFCFVASCAAKAPAANTTCWDSIDPRLLPVILTVSLLSSATCWFFLQCPLLSDSALSHSSMRDP